MAALDIYLLGQFRVESGGEPLTDFETNKVRGLLAYLAVESDRPHGRAVLADLLWPDFSEQRARANLSQALFSLRRTLGDDEPESRLFLISRDTIQLKSGNHFWLDVDAFSLGTANSKGTESHATIKRLEETLALYEGEFLDGFSSGGGPRFEVWCLSTRAHYHRLACDALTRAIDFYEQTSEHETALIHARRLLTLDPWREEAHVSMMRLLARYGRRSEALAQYDLCRRNLKENLGIEPMRRTVQLYESIRDDQADDSIVQHAQKQSASLAAPSFLRSTLSPITSTFVGRDLELAQLDSFLDRILAGTGRVVFVAAEAGSGKTVLVQEFARQAMLQHPNLLYASGKGTAYTGLGDPYIAFRDLASLLTGNVAARCEAGTVSKDQALRLWQTIPVAVRAIVRESPDLLGTFVNGRNLYERAIEYAQSATVTNSQQRYLSQLRQLTKSNSNAIGQHQQALFDQYRRLLFAISQHAPLLLFLDDLQWADSGTINLLFHLSRHLSGQRILLVGAYRPEEITSTYDGQPHPLQPVIHEIQRQFGKVIIELGQTTDLNFVEAIVDSEPNLLGSSFRTKLYQQTNGHPLFTVELLRGLQERGDLAKDEQGRWVEGSELNWDFLPPRVEGVIAERIVRLPYKLQQLLKSSSVQGETFISEISALTLQIKEEQAKLDLGKILSRKHRLIRAKSFDRADNRDSPLSTYQFHHFLFQKYLYESMDETERAPIHEAVGDALASLFGEQVSAMSVQLAHHYEMAKIVPKAVQFRGQAGNYAIQLAANNEAVDHFIKGLRLLKTLPASIERDGLEIGLQLGLGTGYQLMRGYADPDGHEAYSRARDLCNQLGTSPQLVAALWPLATHAAMIGDLPLAIQLAEEALDVARETENPLLILIAHHHLGWILHENGRFTDSLDHQNEVIALYDRSYHDVMVQMFGHDFGITSLGWSAWPLWYLGYPEQALQRCHEAISLAQSFDHPFSLMHAFNMTAMIHSLRGENVKAGEFGERVMSLATTYGYGFYVAPAHFFLGCGLVGRGQIEEGINFWYRSMEIYGTAGAKMLDRGSLYGIAKLYLELGKYDKAQEAWVAADVIEVEDYTPASLCYVRAVLDYKLDQSPQTAEANFKCAISLAQNRHARSVELLATINYSRFLMEMDRNREAKDKLSAIYNWFSEGYDTSDLQTAAALLDELA